MRCNFCNKESAALRVKVPSLRKKKPILVDYCLLHYYTTSAVRVSSEDVSVLNQVELDSQLPAMQAVFADVFLELKQELSEESARSFRATSHDPLAILNKFHKSSVVAPTSNKNPRQKPPPAKARQSHDDEGGGFMQHVPLPERLIRTQREQSQKQQAMVRRMEQAAKHSGLTQRRKPTRKSIWNVMEDAASGKAVTNIPAKGKVDSFLNLDLANDNHMTCSCGSTDVTCLSSSTNRNNESTKGEIWGSGSRDDVVVRYQCSVCGKVWNEYE
jgi:hypothetical protein